MGIFNVFRKDEKDKEKSGAPKRAPKSAVEKKPESAAVSVNKEGSAGEKAVGMKAKKSSSGTEIKPRVTEKTSREEAAGKYTFEVSENSSKPEVKKAVEEIYKTKVASVNLMNVEAKRLGRMRRGYGTRGCFRKAIVTLKPGEKINLT